MDMLRIARAFVWVWSLASAGTLLAQEGRVIFVDGDVRIARRDDPAQPARVGDLVEAESTVSTENGRAHLKFPDQSVVSLQPRTIFRMDQYVFSGREDGSERFFARLIKGGMRTVTGTIGKLNRDRFEIRTTAATVGIRGTSFKMEFCATDCSGKADGLYVDGGEGTTVVSNGFGELLLRSGDSAFVANAQVAPQRSTTTTSVGAPQPRSPASLVGAVREEQKFSDYVFKSGGLQPPFSSYTLSRGAAALAASDNTAASGAIEGGSGQTTRGQLTAAVDGGGAVFGFAVRAANGSGFAIINNVENAGTDGTLYWGRWANGQVQVGGSGANGSGFSTVDFAGARSIHYIMTRDTAIIPSSGSASYTFFSSTPSTSNDGVVGAGVIGGSLTVGNFASNSGSAAVTISHGGLTLTQTGNFQLNAGNRASLASTATGGTYPWGFEGFLGGGNRADGNPARAAISYEIRRPSNFIYGVAGFR